MSEKKTELAELDIARLLALKAFERPDPERLGKNIEKTMNAVRTANKRPSLHFFPDKSTTWMFAQPRYGIAALFILFLGLHMLNTPMPTEVVGSATVEEPGIDVVNITETNNIPTVEVPGIEPVYHPIKPAAASFAGSACNTDLKPTE